MSVPINGPISDVYLSGICLHYQFDFIIGHTRVTHSYLLQGEEHPQCVGCDAPFTVRHFLLECGDFAQVRNNCFHVNNMKELFQDIHIDSIMTFLRQINLFNKI